MIFKGRHVTELTRQLKKCEVKADAYYIVTTRFSSLCTLINKTHKFFMYVYFYSLHVSGNHVPIIGRINCINAIPGVCHSVWTTVWYVGSNLHTRRSSTQNDIFQPAYQTVVHTE